MAGREEINVIENQASQEDDTSLASSFASASGAASPIKELDQQDEKSTASPTVEQKVEKRSEKEIDGAKSSGSQGEEVDSTKKDGVKQESTLSSSSSSSIITKGTNTTVANKPISPLNKFKQLEKQNSSQSPKSPISPQAVGGTGTSPQSPIFKFTDPALSARALTFKEQLLQWCQAKTKEYENVQITNFSTSWNDGLAFCALIHHFLPDSFDYSKLDSKHRRQNFELAFRVADEKAGIAPLLDVEDMVVMKKPDWKCVFTYVQSIFRRFRNCQ